MNEEFIQKLTEAKAKSVLFGFGMNLGKNNMTIRYVNSILPRDKEHRETIHNQNDTCLPDQQLI